MLPVMPPTADATSLLVLVGLLALVLVWLYGMVR